MEIIKIARAIGVLNRTFQSYISSSIADRDVSYSDSIFLINIGDQPGINQEKLSELLAIDKAAIARSIKGLEEKGYIQTARLTQDKRAKALYLTDAGQTFIEFMDSLHQKWVKQVMGDMSEKEIEAFTTGIDLMSSRAKAFKP